MSEKETDQYTDEEAQRRFEAAMRGAREIGHETMEDIPKRSKPHSKMKIGKAKVKTKGHISKKASRLTARKADSTWLVFVETETAHAR